MPTLLFSFPGGRYHATPWGHHVNEGMIEWPPSPWRLLRALIAVGFSTCNWTDGSLPPAFCSLVEKMADVLPIYQLPPATGGHSRHYMPIGVLEKGREKTTLVFDTWAQIGDGVLSVTWDICLTEEETEILGLLASRFGYLGRSESLVTARLEQSHLDLPIYSYCVPCDDSEKKGPGWEQIPLLAPETSDVFKKWFNNAYAKVLNSYHSNSSEKKSNEVDEKKIQNALEPYPNSILSCLQVQTSWLKKHGWSQPPGSRRVFYWRKANAIEVTRPLSIKTKWLEHYPDAMIVSLITQGGNNNALPHINKTLPMADRLHGQIVRRLNGMNNPSITGCDDEKRALTLPHQHSHILPLDLDYDKHIDHFLLWSPMGFDYDAQYAIRSVRKTFAKGEIAPLRLAIAGVGNIESLRNELKGVYGEALKAILGGDNGSSSWRSITPFVPPRYLKTYGKNRIDGQIIDELNKRGFPKPSEIIVNEPKDNVYLQQRHFKRSRHNGPIPKIDCGFTVILKFDEPVRGPIAIGYASHFGLGLFGAFEI